MRAAHDSEVKYLTIPIAMRMQHMPGPGGVLCVVGCERN